MTIHRYQYLEETANLEAKVKKKKCFKYLDRFMEVVFSFCTSKRTPSSKEKVKVNICIKK